MKHTNLEITGTQPGLMPGQIRVFVAWRECQPFDGSLHYQNGKYCGNSGNIPRYVVPRLKRLAQAEVDAMGDMHPWETHD